MIIDSNNVVLDWLRFWYVLSYSILYISTYHRHGASAVVSDA